MNKNFILLILIAFVAWYVIKRKSISRAEMIDFLNNKVGLPYKTATWTMLTDEELRIMYKPFALVVKNIQPTEEMYLDANNVLKKYGMSFEQLRFSK